MAEQTANEEISESLQSAIDQSVRRAVDDVLNRLAETESAESAYLRSQRRPTVDQAPYFDWKWAIGTAIAIIAILSPIILAGISGYFQIKGDLGIVKTKVDRLQTDLNSLKSKVESLEKQVGEIRVINNRLNGIEKTLDRIEASTSQRGRGG